MDKDVEARIEPQGMHAQLVLTTPRTTNTRLRIDMPAGDVFIDPFQLERMVKTPASGVCSYRLLSAGYVDLESPFNGLPISFEVELQPNANIRIPLHARYPVPLLETTGTALVTSPIISQKIVTKGQWIIPTGSLGDFEKVQAIIVLLLWLSVVVISYLFFKARSRCKTF